MKLLTAVSLAVLLLAAGATQAQDKKGQQEALRRLQASNQRLASEKAQLEREKAKLEAERDEAAKARRSAEGSLKGERGTVAKQKKDLEALEEAKRGLEEKLAEAAKREDGLKQELTQTAKALAEAQSRGEQLAKRLANQQQTIGFWQGETDACRSKNTELGKLGNELLARYRAKTCEDVQNENEPFTGIGRARAENLLDDYRVKLREQSFEVKK
ncbi:MAG TPA: hypothetical protein VKE95_17060 [Burkholderiales bacterium]|nr:hypothetical protein [Burkholderiales bacterium]